MIRDKPDKSGQNRTKADKVVRINADTVGKMIDRLNDHHEAGEIDGLMVVVKLKDGTFECGWPDSIGFAERIGLAECLKADMIRRASCPFEQ